MKHGAAAHGDDARSGALRWVLLGRVTMTVSNGLLMLGAALLFMDPPTFGWFASAIGAQLLFSRGILVGLDQTVVRLHTAHPPQRVLRAGVGIALVLGLAVLAGGAAAMALPDALLARIDLPDRRLAWAVPLGAVGTAWLDIAIAMRLAHTAWRSAGLFTAAAPAFRAVVTLIACAATPTDSLLPAVVFAAATAACGAPLLVDAGLRHGWLPRRGDVVRLLRYSVWVGVGDAAAILALYLGVFLLVADGQDAEAGRLGLALQVAQLFFAVFVAFYQSLLPQAARLPSPTAVRGFLRTSWRRAGWLAAGTVVLAVIALVVLPFLLRSLDRADMFGLEVGLAGLTVFTIVLMFEAPLGVICQYLLRPRLQVAALTLRCALIAGLGWLLVPRHGAAGAGIAQALGALLAALALGAMVSAAVDRRTRELAACVAS